jgi:hypothetical protein
MGKIRRFRDWMVAEMDEMGKGLEPVVETG